MGNKDARRYPVISLGAEHLVIGHLMRRNILAYKAPPNNEGYDLICIHPDPRRIAEQIRVQVKSRYQTDCDRAFPVKEKTFEAFDYLIVVFLNNGYYYKKSLFGMALPNQSSIRFRLNLSKEIIKKQSLVGNVCLQREKICSNTRTSTDSKSLPWILESRIQGPKMSNKLFRRLVYPHTQGCTL